MKDKDVELHVTKSSDYDHDPKGALRALDKTNVAVIVISKSWFDDKQTQEEYQHAVDLGKPMIYIFRNILPDNIKDKSILNYPNLCGILYDYTKTGDELSPITLIGLRKMLATIAKTEKMQ